ncbi:MAG TPA: D-aminoacyl-tRNA deacylase [Thermoanaerobaculia bacterium]|nr:D-aminoacyl-tRNA deacylase [Thermoanaerobaculia bacterium]
MRTVLQRVRRASVRVRGEVVGEIESGLLALVGIAADDGAGQVRATAQKIRGLRIFEDQQGRMNLDVVQAGGAVLVVSQFTLVADVTGGRRPSFSSAAPAERASELMLALATELRDLGVPVAEGRFGASMEVELINDGPVTFVLETADLTDC